MFVQVSFGSELSNRAPTFDMDLSDFMDGDKPISYDKAKEYFSLPIPKVRYFILLYNQQLFMCVDS